MLRFSIGNAFRKKGVTSLALLGVGLGVALMSTLLSLSEGMDKRIESTLTQVAADVSVVPVDAPFGALFGGGTPLPKSYIENIKVIPNVAWVYPQVLGTIPSQVLGSKLPFGAPITGVDPLLDREINGPTRHITQGRVFSNEGEMIVGNELLTHSRFTGIEYKIGQEFEIPVLSDQSPQINSLAATASAAPNRSVESEKVRLKIVGFFTTGNVVYDRSLYADFKTVRKLAKLTDEEFSSLRVRATSVDKVDQVAKDIEKALQDGEVKVTVTLARDILGNVNDTLSIFRNFLLVIGLIAAISGGVSIFIIMLLGVLERRREFGILKAAGWSNVNILFSVILESVTIGILGAIAGLTAGFVATEAIERYLEEGTAIYSPELVLGVLGFGILMGVAGGLYPAVRAAQVTPMETLKAL